MAKFSMFRAALVGLVGLVCTGCVSGGGSGYYDSGYRRGVIVDYNRDARRHSRYHRVVRYERRDRYHRHDRRPGFHRSGDFRRSPSFGSRPHMDHSDRGPRRDMIRPSRGGDFRAGPNRSSNGHGGGRIHIPRG
jgi:hypothetical protein